ncbi:MobV family relaxase [Burkholderia gladioli]|uniref:MobV family relaxase n=1 Tax=Burkholderia gladioli TaxID=28095 RepID=UPI000F5AB676|nr:MobV family relaxase [Burkholderia gladioli]RQV19508.1 hypothetical protein DF039_14020 [Burkholderia cenocepacia]
MEEKKKKNVINVQKYNKTMRGAMVAIAAHNLRNVESANVDGTRTPDNIYYVGDPNTDILAELDKRLENVEKFRKDAVQLVNIVLSATPDWFNQGGSAEDWGANAQRWLEEQFGTENIIYSVMHLDEKTPHIHCAFVPLRNNKLQASYWFDGPKKLRTLHDSYAVATKKLGIERGTRYSKATSESVQNHYDDINMSAEDERKLNVEFKQVLANLREPNLRQRLSFPKYVAECLNPFLGKLAKLLKHYKAKANERDKYKKLADTLEADNSALNRQVEDLTNKIDALGLNPNARYFDFEQMGRFLHRFDVMTEIQPEQRKIDLEMLENGYILKKIPKATQNKPKI